MSDNSDIKGKQRHIGVISGFDEITTDPSAGTYPRAEHDFTLPDLLALLRNLKAYLNPDKLTELEKMITDHLSDYKNPHKVSLETLGTSVLQELYKLWLSEGHVGSEDQFLKEIFQYVTIADVQTTLEGKARDQVPSVYGLARYVDMHDKDPNAHDELFKRLFPGAPIWTEPSISFHGYCGLPEFIDIERPSEMYYITSAGGIGIAAPNSIPCDFTFGIGTFPIFGECIGHIANNADMAQLGSKCELVNITTSYHSLEHNTFDTIPESKYVRIKEVETSSPVEHALIYTETDEVFEKDVYYTVEFFVRNLREDVSANLVGLHLPGVFEDPYSFMNFNLIDGTTFKNDDVPDQHLSGGVASLKNGWFRVWATFFVKEETPMMFKIVPLDIVDGDSGYTGTGVFTMDILYPQITVGEQIPPPLISTTDEKPILEPTFLTLNLSKIYLGKFNPIEGTTVITVTCPTGDTGNVKYIYELSSDTRQVISARIPSNHKRRVYTTWHSETGSSISYKYLNMKEGLFSTFAHSYSPFEQLFMSSGGTDESSEHPKTALSPKSNILYIGCDRYKTPQNVLNGYISSFSYYPFKCSVHQLKFLIGDK